MLKKRLIILFLGIGTLVHAEVSPYLSLSGGLSSLKNDSSTYNNQYSSDIDFDEGYIVEGAFGIHVGSLFRTELALAYQNNTIENHYTIPGQPNPVPGLPPGLPNTKEEEGSVSVTSYMWNGYFDLNNKSAFTPYVMAGIGYAQTQSDSAGEIERDYQYAYQVGAGVGYALTEKVTLDLKYKFFSTFDDFEFTNNQEFAYINNQLQAGLRYHF